MQVETLSNKCNIYDIRYFYFSKITTEKNNTKYQ